MFGWHISFEYLYFKSRRKEWSVRVWKDVRYVRPLPKPRGITEEQLMSPYKLEPDVLNEKSINTASLVAKFIPSFKGETRNMVSGMGVATTSIEMKEGTDGIIKPN